MFFKKNEYISINIIMIYYYYYYYYYKKNYDSKIYNSSRASILLNDDGILPVKTLLFKYL